MLKDESAFLDSNIWLYAFIRDKVGEKKSRTEDYMEIQDQLFEGLSTQEVYEKAAEFWHSTTMRDTNQTISVG